MARVETGCRDCKRCNNSAVNEGARKTGRFTAAVATVGISEVGRAFTRNCRGCGHPLSLHAPAPTAASAAPAPAWLERAAAWKAAQTPAAPAPAAAPQQGQDVMATLRELGELRDAGVITPQEFDAKKSELLDRL